MGKKSKNQTQTEELKTEDVKPISNLDRKGSDDLFVQPQAQKRGKKENEESFDNEEQKVAVQSSGAPLKRRNSRFLLEEKQNKGKEQAHYRPEFGTGKEGSEKNEKIWELMSSYIGTDKKSIQRSIVNHVEYTLARTRFNFDNFGAYQAASYSIRDRLIEAWNDTQ